MNQKQLSDLLIALGGLAEMAGILCKELLKNGFTREEAVNIVGKYVVDQLRPRPEMKGDDTE